MLTVYLLLQKGWYTLIELNAILLFIQHLIDELSGEPPQRASAAGVFLIFQHIIFAGMSIMADSAGGMT